MAAPPAMMVMDPNAMSLAGQVANTRADVLNAGANNTSAVLQGQSGDTQTLLQSGCGETASIIANNERTAFHTQAQVDRQSHGHNNLLAAGFLEGRSLANAGFTANLLAAKDAQLATAIAEGKVLQTIAVTNGSLIKEISESRESVKGLVGNLALQNQVELSKYFAIAERETNKQFALATLAASQNAASIAAKVEECCCEVKATVNSTANDTQALIQATEANRVRDALAASQQENLFLRLRVPPPFPPA
jgi:hypothetical protein